MNEKEMRKEHKRVAEALFADGFSDVFGKVGAVIGLTDDKDLDDVMCSFEDRVKAMVKGDESTRVPIYEKLAPGEVLILEKTEEYFLVASNYRDDRFRVARYSHSTADRMSAMTSDEAVVWLEQTQAVVAELKGALDSLKKFFPEEIQPLDDADVDDEEKPDDIESLDDPRVMGFDEAAEKIRERHRP